MRTLFISDLHLDDRRPAALEWLAAFLQGPAVGADALYILGDLFEYWIGDDAVPPAARDLANALAALSAAGTATYFMHGNRDFLVGEEYARSAGLTLLPESVVVDLYGAPTLLLHGDTLCTDDIAYQAVRRQVRDPQWQAQVLALPVPRRLEMARDARDASARHTGTASMEIMDVNEQAVREAFLQHHVRRMIHGHTHRPAVHRHDLGGGVNGERIVLADWYDRASYLEVTAGGYRQVAL